MAKTLETDLQKAIEENLPSMVGAQLKDLLQEHEDLKEDHANLAKEHKQLQKDYKEIAQKDRNYDDLESKRKMLEDENNQLALQKQIMELKEGHAKERVSEIRNLTETVFRSNRMNYNVDFSLPNPNYGKEDPNSGMTDYNHQTYCTGSVEKDDSQK